MAVKLTIQFKGLDTVIANLNKKIQEIEGYTMKGVVAAALHVKGEAMRRAPVDTGNLVNSAYVVWPRGGDTGGTADGGIVGGAKMSTQQAGKPTAIIGFTAAYAVYVHEIDKHYRKPGSSWKFLELALMESEEKILEFIRASVKEGAKK